MQNMRNRFSVLALPALAAAYSLHPDSLSLTPALGSATAHAHNNTSAAAARSGSVNAQSTFQRHGSYKRFGVAHGQVESYRIDCHKDGARAAAVEHEHAVSASCRVVGLWARSGQGHTRP